MAREKGWYWPIVIVGILVLGLAPSFLLVALATNDPSFAVEEDYYEKALAWDSLQAEKRRSTALGWSVDLRTEIDPVMAGFQRVTAVIRDREGVAIPKCEVHVEAFHNARAAHRVKSRLEPIADGAHLVVLPMRRAGLWEFRFDATCGATAFTSAFTHEIDRVAP